MKHVLVLTLLIVLMCCSCVTIFVTPDDASFLAVVERLNTPQKICQYMLNNFETEEHPYVTLTPYQLYITKKGDCDDFTAFAQFIANWHGYETYRIRILFAEWVYGYYVYHMMPVFVEGNCLTFAENQYYFGYCNHSFGAIMAHYCGWVSYTVYDYWDNIVARYQQ